MNGWLRCILRQQCGQWKGFAEDSRDLSKVNAKAPEKSDSCHPEAEHDSPMVMGKASRWEGCPEQATALRADIPPVKQAEVYAQEGSVLVLNEEYRSLLCLNLFLTMPPLQPVSILSYRFTPSSSVVVPNHLWDYHLCPLPRISWGPQLRNTMTNIHTQRSQHQYNRN